MRQNLRARKTSRTAFTLIEILVVISIITALVALSAAATIRFISTQQVKNTEATIKTVDSEFSRQWAAVIRAASSESEPPCNTALSLSGGDRGIARVIHIKLRLKQEFPMTYFEALSPQIDPGTGTPDPTLPPLPEYQRALAGVTIDNPPTPDENSACLAMALQRSRGGKEASLDDLLTPGVIGRNQYGLKIIKDAWGQPIVFYRWPTANPEVDNSGPGPNSIPKVQPLLRDMQDPTGQLQQSTWWQSNNRLAFEGICHRVSPYANMTQYANYVPSATQYAYYMPPVIVSGGPNKKLGILSVAVNGPDPMQLDPLKPDDFNDNLYSFRLRLGGKGD